MLHKQVAPLVNDTRVIQQQRLLQRDPGIICTPEHAMPCCLTLCLRVNTIMQRHHTAVTKVNLACVTAANKQPPISENTGFTILVVQQNWLTRDDLPYICRGTAYSYRSQQALATSVA
jgi:hypothetical protein